MASETEPFENEDLIPIPSICLTRGGIQNYVTVPVLSRNNHDILLPPNILNRLLNQVQSITPIEQVHKTEKEEEKLISKNNHKMGARHHIRDESIDKEKKNSKACRQNSQGDRFVTFIDRATSESSGFNNRNVSCILPRQCQCW